MDPNKFGSAEDDFNDFQNLCNCTRIRAIFVTNSLLFFSANFNFFGIVLFEKRLLY